MHVWQQREQPKRGEGARWRRHPDGPSPQRQLDIFGAAASRLPRAIFTRPTSPAGLEETEDGAEGVERIGGGMERVSEKDLGIEKARRGGREGDGRMDGREECIFTH